VKTFAILISGQGTHMANLARACRDAQLPGRIGLVLSNRDHAPGVALARELGLPVETLAHGDFASREAFDEALSARLDARGIELVVLAGFMRILTDTFVRRFEGRLVNIHPSLLPAFPGLDTHARALAAGVRLHGATAHLVTAELDHGPILAQAAVRVTDHDDAEHRLYPRAVQWLLEDRVRVIDGRALIDGVTDEQRLILEDAP
jgi:phosphoribosylglycinamide formyltransferase-1